MTVLVRYGEIGLKGNNRHLFEKRLVKNIGQCIGKHISDAKIVLERGRIFIEIRDEKLDELILLLKNIPGIFSVSPSIRCESNLESMETVIANVAKNAKVQTFKVEVSRPNKQFPMTSPQLAAELGGIALRANPRLNVDVHHPELIIEVEVREETYIFTERISGLGGMPYGTAGRALSLFSGGIDSPVATYMMARRGTEVSLLHFHSAPFTGPLSEKKVEDLATVIAKYTGKVRLTKVNILEIQKAIKEHCPEEEMTILSRCFMMKIATKIAEKEKCSAVITGESIGQVASQTMESISVTSAMTNYPVFRPLIASDKSEIIKTAKEIGTFEISILPYEDCCTIFLPPHVVTKPRLEKIEHSLSLLDVEALVSGAVTQSKVEYFYSE